MPYTIEESRLADWEIREQAFDDPDLSDRAKYELITYGIQGPGQKWNEYLNGLDESVGKLVIATDQNSIARGYIGHIAAVNYICELGITFQNHLPDEFLAIKSELQIAVPNLRRFSGGAVYRSFSDNEALIDMQIWDRQASNKNHDRITLAEKICISPYISGWDENGVVIYNFTHPIFGRNMPIDDHWSIFSGMTKPRIYAGDRAADWIENHVRNKDDILPKIESIAQEIHYS